MPDQTDPKKELERLNKIGITELGLAQYEIARASLVLAVQVARIAEVLERSRDGGGRLLVKTVDR